MRKAMKKVLFASTALAAMAIGGAASAQGITLFGDARLGLGYNIQNDGSVLLNDVTTEELASGKFDPVTGDEIILEQDTYFEDDGDIRAISRVRFGVRMSGETNSGITFGATIRADNAGNGQGGTAGQRAGSVFAQGAWGTVTFGDTNGADEQHVGDINGTGSVTGLGDLNETFFFTNGGEFSSDSGFTAAPDKRPTVRYDYNFAGFGVSASTDRDLEDISVGGSYTFDFAGGSFTGGLGWADVNGRDVVDDIEQWSVGLGGTFGDFNGKFTYTDGDSGSEDLRTWGIGLGYTMAEWTINGYYHKVDKATGGIDGFDGKDSYGVGVAYDLGGGAVLAGGVAKTFGRNTQGNPFVEDVDDLGAPLGTFSNNADFRAGRDSAVVADFGIRMSF
jgi:outer membrane protein OmpU